MEIESNNNTLVPEYTKEYTAQKRSSTVEDEDVVAHIKRLKEDNEPECNANTQKVESPVSPDKGTSARQRPPTQNPKKRIQIDYKHDGGVAKMPKSNKQQTYIFGNYRQYYGKRILDKDFHDIRLDILATQPELFRGKQLLDIGCNSGHLSLEIAKKFEVKSLTGLDIDRVLTQEAQIAVNMFKRSCNVSATSGSGKFPYNVKFVQGNYVLVDDVLLEIERPQFDVILCLSVTKWIHLNFGDSGLKQAFRRMYLQLRPGGNLILEPQSFDTYKRRKNLSDHIRDNYNTIKFKPEEFSTYLLGPEVGFTHMELMGVPDHCKVGFKRPIQIFRKN